MAPPLSASDFLSALRGAGCAVREVPGWRTHNRAGHGPWGPVHGIVVHHTATSGTTDTVRLCRDGREGLPGPLCHGVIAKDGTIHLVGHGRANHAGRGDSDVLRAVIEERPLPPVHKADADGNTHFYGLECVNLGDGRDPWPADQLAAIARTAAALCRRHGWTERSVIGHREWRPGKVDPTGFTMDRLRARVRDRLAGHPAAPPE
ncbi:N-acetylmuramoyl-L-alanine amidase [Streptomyces orinoci]|uniref:Peptidoglycan recognition family protein n=1 Tax=Streptomyces orinoci TaxID=67339 RepID=A0ABV3JWL5_STRON|nr:peptidoglycan recognition family protein [Streptomyces orinoci]